MYNVVEVIGSGMPSQNAKYVGATPSMALNKATPYSQEEPLKLQFGSSCAACLPSTLSVSSTCTM
jgi:hypothetical protein